MNELPSDPAATAPPDPTASLPPNTLPPYAGALADAERPRYFPGGPRFAFFVLLVALLAAAFYTLRAVLLGPLLAAAVASLTFPYYLRLARWLRGHRQIAALVSVLVILTGVVGPLTWLAVICGQRLAVEIPVVNPTLSHTTKELVKLTARLGPSGEPLRRYAANLSTTVTEALPEVARRAGDLATVVGGLLVQAMIALMLFCLALYYFFVDGEAWRERFIHLMPIRHDYARTFLWHFRQVSIAVVVGNLGTAAVQGLIGGLGYWAFGITAPLLWGVVTGAASFVPVFGTTTIWLPMAIFLAFTTSWLRGVLLFCFGVVMVGLSDNVVRPVLTRWGMQMHPLLVFLSLFGGLEAFGLEGLFIGPLVLALAQSALTMYENEPSL